MNLWDVESDGFGERKLVDGDRGNEGRRWKRRDLIVRKEKDFDELKKNGEASYLHNTMLPLIICIILNFFSLFCKEIYHITTLTCKCKQQIFL